MAGARNWDVRLPGDPPAEIPEPWFIRQAREGREKQASRTVPDWPEELRPRELGEDAVETPAPPPPPDAARKAALQAVMIDTGRERRRALRFGAVGLIILVVAIAVGWTLRGLLEPPVTVPRFVDDLPTSASPALPPVVQAVPREAPAPAVEIPELPPVAAAPTETPAEVAAVTSPPERIAVPAPTPIPALKPAPARAERVARAAPPTKVETARRDEPEPVAAPVRSADPACDPSAPRGLRFVCGDATLGAMNRDYLAASARIAALDDPEETRRLARDNQRFLDRRDRCDDAGCVADRYGDRLEAVEARLRHVERREAKTTAVTEGDKPRLPECKGFQYFRPTTPCTTRRSARD